MLQNISCVRDSYNHLPSPLFDFILNTEQDIRYKLLMQMWPSELWYSVSWELRRSPTTATPCCYTPSLLLSTHCCLSPFRWACQYMTNMCMGNDDDVIDASLIRNVKCYPIMHYFGVSTWIQTMLTDIRFWRSSSGLLFTSPFRAFCYVFERLANV